MSNVPFYRACNLSSNPFRSNATFDDDPRLGIWAGQEKERLLLEKFLLRSRSEQVGNTNLVLLHGHFGTGKSHALLWSVRWARSYNEGGPSAAYYIPTLKKDKGKLSFGSAFVDDLIAKTRLLADVLDYRHFLQRCVAACTNETGSIDDTIERILPSVDLYNFAKEIYRVEDEEGVRALLAPKGLTDYQAMSSFSRLVNLFVYEVRLANEVRRFKQSVYLMIDELDILQQASTKEVYEVNDLIRHLYDMSPNCFCLLLGVSAEQEMLPSMFTEYVLTRVSRQIEFKPFDRASALDFVVQVLDANRVDPNDGNRARAFPFSSEALDAIVGQIASRTPRRVVNVMHQVIEEVRLAGLDPATAPFTIEALDAAGVTDEIF